MSNTSLAHPIQIAEVKTGEGWGRIGITFCPDTIAPSRLGDIWNSELGIDLDAISMWGASTVITLIENHDLDMLSVEELDSEIRQRHMQWLHLPVCNLPVPDGYFDEAWNVFGEPLRSQLMQGFDVLIHCHGGGSQAETIAAQLLVELGVMPSDAIERIRVSKPGAVVTRDQENYIHEQRFIPELEPSNTIEAIRDRALGALFGLAVGDAIGTTVEFCPRDSYHPVQDMVGGGPFGLEAGQWTDDTAMALALADCLNDPSGFSEHGLMSRFADWYKNGSFSCTGDCFDIGMATRQAIERWISSGNPQTGSIDPKAAGNGSLMRLAPVAVRYWNDRDLLRDVAARQSKVTHSAPEAVDACVFWAELLADAIEGSTRSRVFKPRHQHYEGRVSDVAKGSWRFRNHQTIKSGGYVIESLEAALWCSSRSISFKEAVLAAANLGEDADTTAAITGQLAGALAGYTAIPAAYLEKLAWHDTILGQGESLFAKSLEH